MRRYLSLEPTSVEELLGQGGWSLGPRGDSLIDRHGNEAFFLEQDDGRVELRPQDGSDVADLLERVPFEEVSHA